jgi:hypothetical protein
MSVLTDLDASYLEHRRCGELGVKIDETAEADRITLTCSCGGKIRRLSVAYPEPIS